MSRYINADGKYFPTKYRMNTSSYAKGWNACIDSILQCSAADVQEVKHGQWVKYGMDIAEHPLHCSVCGWSNYHISNKYIEEFGFCPNPNCGAKMDEEAK